jgi:hypothetical protein
VDDEDTVVEGQLDEIHDQLTIVEHKGAAGVVGGRRCRVHRPSHES